MLAVSMDVKLSLRACKKRKQVQWQELAFGETDALPQKTSQKKNSLRALLKICDPKKRVSTQIWRAF